MEQKRKPKLIPIKQHDGRYSQYYYLFAKYDHDGSGSLTKAEFQAGFQEFGLIWSQEMDKEFDAWDASGDGQVSIEEFTSKLADPNYLRGFLNTHKAPTLETSTPSFPLMNSNNFLKKTSGQGPNGSNYFDTIFESADRDKSGTLTKAQFRDCFQSLGLQWSEDLEAEFESWDVDRDGQVSYQEFTEKMSNPKDLQEFLKKHAKSKRPMSKPINAKPEVPMSKPIRKSSNDINSNYFTTIFESADRDKSGTLTKAEFQDCFQSLGLQWSKDLEAEFKSWDVDRDGQVSYQEFTKKMSNPKDLQEFLKKHAKPKPIRTPGDHMNADYFMTIFESADRSKTGTLTKTEFQNCFQSLGLDWSKDFEAEFKSWDVDGDGQVSYQEFTKKISNPKILKDFLQKNVKQGKSVQSKQSRFERKLAGIGRRKKPPPIPPKIKPERPLILDLPDVEEPNILLRTSPTKSPRSPHRSLEFNFDANYEENDTFEAELPKLRLKEKKLSGGIEPGMREVFQMAGLPQSMLQDSQKLPEIEAFVKQNEKALRRLTRMSMMPKYHKRKSKMPMMAKLDEAPKPPISSGPPPPPAPPPPSGPPPPPAPPPPPGPPPPPLVKMKPSLPRKPKPDPVADSGSDLLQSIQGFQKGKLKPVEVEETKPSDSRSDLLQSIQSFQKGKLKPVEVDEAKPPAVKPSSDLTSVLQNALNGISCVMNYSDSDDSEEDDWSDDDEW